MNHKSQYGAVSLFIVVFAALLITVVTVSFIRIMITDQQQATATDLSRSAYDSAQAGVEDAKRALLRFQAICNGSDQAACATATAQINSNVCNASLTGVVDTSGSEVKVQQNSGDSALDQAYTCVKIKLQTDDYIGSLNTDDSVIVPLIGVSAFDTVQLEWFSSNDLSASNNLTVDLQDSTSLKWPLLAQTSWATNRPAIMRTQLMQFGSNGFLLSDFDNTNAASQSDANTLFLYPSGTTGTSVSAVDQKTFSGRDTRKTPTGSPLPITCSGKLTTGGYACRVQLTLPVPIGAGNRTAFLRLSALYNKANYRVTLLSGAVPVQFNAVQPEVDSTGRANDLFRRVSSRVELADTHFPYPNAAVDTTGNFCKDFSITDKTVDYKNNCTP